MNNKGISLIELIVIIAIMGVLVGGASLGIGLVFSKDAMKCATRLNDSIYDARANSMYKAGKFELSIDNSGSANVATISQTDLTPVTSDTVYLDGVDSGKKTTISARFVTVTEAVPEETDLRLPLNLTFDKAKGNVYSVVDADGMTYGDGIIVFEIEPLRGNRNRKAKVQLVTTTGKHTIGEFK
ncbi:MAG: prepilin-type N-terminal cleavage/methylation domain-containing protein [Lachnospiraceae bacterium]|nr:type II secretion system GspH family protein [Lachnospiraceae bacterium]MDY5640845.1 prepilin-type N-terminal cleavage/methylation domain-containing protein [Lachnospiraceae bacterium]